MLTLARHKFYLRKQAPRFYHNVRQVKLDPETTPFFWIIWIYVRLYFVALDHKPVAVLQVLCLRCLALQTAVTARLGGRVVRYRVRVNKQPMRGPQDHRQGMVPAKYSNVKM